MAFGTAVTTSQTLTFGPSRVDISWDGVSNGLVEIQPVCSDTSTTAAYSVNVLHVFPEAGEKTINSGSGTETYSYSPGMPFKTSAYPTAATAVPFVIGNTLSTSGIVAFELQPSNTNYTATLDYAEYQTMQASFYSWSLVQSRGTATQTVASGRIARIPPNPYSGGSISGSLVAAKTAYFCIG